MKYNKYYFINLWDLINVVKKDIDNDYKIIYFKQYKGHQCYFRWKCFESKNIYEFHHYFKMGYVFEDTPKIFAESLSQTSPEELKTWIKENSKNIDSFNRLKAFT